jgi:anaerobic selenocysteine-containing dehydrogenase
MQITKLQVDNLTVDTFTTLPQPAGPADEPNFMINNDCTGCMSGCGIMAY